MNEFEIALANINKVGDLKTKQHKLDTLRSLTETEAKILQYTYDPYKMFGVKVYPPYEGPKTIPPTITWPEVFEAFDQLYTRAYTGNAAKYLCQRLVSKGVPDDLVQKILNKDFRIGAQATLINEAIPGLIPEFKCMLAEEYEEAEDNWPKYGSIKYDGLRCLAFVTQEGVSFKTRNGLEITSADKVKQSLWYSWDIDWEEGETVFDGELVVDKAHFQDSMSALRKKHSTNDNVKFMIFDWVPLKDFVQQKSTISQNARINTLELWQDRVHCESAFKIVAHDELHNNDEVMLLYRKVRGEGHEGLIVKEKYSTYQYRRHKAWTKLKDAKPVDLKVIGLEEGKGKYKGHVGKVIVEFNGKENRVGGGISDKQRKAWFDDPSLIVDHMIEVTYTELTKDGNFRHARMTAVRPDND